MGLILFPRRETTLGLLEVTPPKTGGRGLGPPPFGRLTALVRVKPRVNSVFSSNPFRLKGMDFLHTTTPEGVALFPLRQASLVA